MLRHMLPNAIGPVIVQATLTLATAILDAAALSFLGLGDADPGRAEWGLMLAQAQTYLDVRPALAFYPAVAIIVVALGLHAARRVAARGTRPQGTPMTVRTPAPTAHGRRHRCCQVRDLRVAFRRRGEPDTVAVDGVSFDVEPGQVVGLVGESGCGKSVTSLAIMRLLPAARRAGHRLGEDGRRGPAHARPRRRCASAAAATSSMVFQDPLSSLNPVIPIGLQITEVLRRHRGMDKEKAPQGGRRRCWTGSASPTRAGASPPTRTSSPAACAQRAHDRDRAGLPAPAADRRRADDRAGRHHPGADPGAAAASWSPRPAPR